MLMQIVFNYFVPMSYCKNYSLKSLLFRKVGSAYPTLIENGARSQHTQKLDLDSSGVPKAVRMLRCNTNTRR